MRYAFALVAAAGLTLGAARDARAQFALSVGNPYGGGLYVGSNYGSPYWFSSGTPYGMYSSGYYGMSGLAPMTGVYSSGYAGVMPGVGVTTFSTPYVYRSYYGYNYPGYYGSRYGYRGGLGPFGRFGLGRGYYRSYPGFFW